MSGAGQTSDGAAGQESEADGEPPHPEQVEEDEETPPAAKQPRMEHVCLDLHMTETHAVDMCGSQGAVETDEGESISSETCYSFCFIESQYAQYQYHMYY